MSIEHQIKTIRETIEQLTTSMMRSIMKVDCYFSNNRNVSFDWLSKIPMEEPVQLAAGVIALRKKSNDPQQLLFETRFPIGTELPPHTHDCYEEVRVLSGKAEDTLNHKLYRPGDTIIIPPRQLHQFVALTEFIIEVKFYQ